MSIKGSPWPDGPPCTEEQNKEGKQQRSPKTQTTPNSTPPTFLASTRTKALEETPIPPKRGLKGDKGEEEEAEEESKSKPSMEDLGSVQQSRLSSRFAFSVFQFAPIVEHFTKCTISSQFAFPSSNFRSLNWVSNGEWQSFLFEPQFAFWFAN